MKVILAGSGKNMTNINNWDTAGMTIVGVNNVWKGTDKWNYLLHAGDYPDRDKITKTGSQRTITFNSEMNYQESYAGMAKMPYKRARIFLGLPIYFTVAHWVLWHLKPTHIGCIGFDMNYTPSANGETAFYGVGHDMKTRGIPDPLYQFRHIPEYKRMKDPYGTLMSRLQERIGNCKVLNLSNDPQSMLPWEQVTFEEFSKM
jgi:hypothetical protein